MGDGGRYAAREMHTSRQCFFTFIITDLLIECELEGKFFPRLTSDVNIEVL